MGGLNIEGSLYMDILLVFYILKNKHVACNLGYFSRHSVFTITVYQLEMLHVHVTQLYTLLPGYFKHINCK